MGESEEGLELGVMKKMNMNMKMRDDEDEEQEG